MTLEESKLRADLAKASFRMGEADIRWKLLGIAWPFATIAVVARDGTAFALRFDCASYPDAPPTAVPWDHDRNAKLPFERWPQSAGGRVRAVFRRDWENGDALYLPCDRRALRGHEQWRHEHPSKIWVPSKGIVFYLEIVHELLNSRDYVPPARAAA